MSRWIGETSLFLLTETTKALEEMTDVVCGYPRLIVDWELGAGKV